MESANPQAHRLESILESLDTWIPDFDPEAVHTGLAMIGFATAVLAAAEAHFGRYGLSQGRFTVLMFLYHFEEVPWTPAELAEAAGVRRATTTGLLKGLERDGWISRSPHPDDGRSTLITLTEDGRKRLVALLPDHFGRFGAVTEGVPVEEQRQFRDLLGFFADRLATLRPEA